MTRSATTRAQLGARGLAVLSGAAIALTAAALPAVAAPQQHAKIGPHIRTHSAAQRGVRSHAAAVTTTGFTPLTARLLDTRVDQPTGAVSGLVQTMVTDDLPSGTTVELTVTAVAPAASGYITAYGDTGAGAPLASNVDYAGRGVTTSSTVVATVPDSGIIDLNIVGNPTNVIVDQQGYFDATTLTDTAPVRIGDSRTGLGFAKGTKSGVTKLTIPSGAVPAGSGVLALNVTTQSPTAGNGYVSVYSGGAAPRTSSVNYNGGVATNLVFVTPAADGTVSFNVVGVSTNLIVDLDAYAPAGSTFTTTGAVRVADSRTDPDGPVQDGITVQALPVGTTVPAGTSVALNITAAGAYGNGYTVAFIGATQPPTSELQYHSGGATAQTIVVPVDSDGTVNIAVPLAPTDIIVDREGVIGSGS